MPKFGDGYIPIHGDLSPLRRDLVQATGAVKTFSKVKAQATLGLDKLGFDKKIAAAEVELAAVGRDRARAELTLDTDGFIAAEAKIAALKKSLNSLATDKIKFEPVELRRSLDAINQQLLRGTSARQTIPVTIEEHGVTKVLAALKATKAQVDELDRKLDRFANFKAVVLRLDDDQAEIALKKWEARLAALGRKKIAQDLELDTEGAAETEAEIVAVNRELSILRKHAKVKVKVDVDRSAWDRFRTAVAQSQKGKGFASALGFGGGSGVGDKGAFAFLGGTGGSGRFVSALGAHSLPVLASAAFVAEGALAALAAAAIALGAALAPLVGLLGVIPPALAGLGQVASGLFATFSGIGDAVRASNEVATKSGLGETAALEQQKAAADAVRGAKESLISTQLNAQRAQEGLTDARKDAARTLEDMKNQAESAALAEQGSALALREARNELNRVANDPGSSALDIEQAELGLKVARQGAREARIEAARSRRDSDRAQAGGVEKLPQVVAAKQQLADANRSVTQSTRALARAQEQAAADTSKLSASEEKLKESMAKLGPAGRHFVRFIVGLKPAFESIRRASQEAALPHFEKGIASAMKNLPTFRKSITDTSRVLSVGAENFGKFVGSKGFGKDFAIITRTNNNVLRNFGRAMVPLGKAFNDVSVAAAPFVRWIGRAVLHLARMAAHSAKAGRESGGLAQFFRRTRDVLESLGKILGNVVHGLGGLFGAAWGDGKNFLDLLVSITDRFDNWANSLKGESQIKDFMEDMRGPLREVGEAIGAVAILVKDLALAPGSGLGLKLFAQTVGLLAKGLDLLARVPGVGGILANLALLTVLAGKYERLGLLAKFIGKVGGALGSLASSVGRTRVGESIATKIAQGLQGGTIYIRRALTSIRGLFTRILGRIGIGAGAAAAEQMGAQLGASTLPGGKLGRQAGKFRNLGRLFGGALGFGILAGLGVHFIPKIIESLKGTGEPQPVQTPQQPLQDPSRLSGRPRSGQFSGPALTGVVAFGDDTEKGKPPKKPKKDLPSRVKTIEIETPILSLKAGDVKKSMDRIIEALRVKLQAVNRLMADWRERWENTLGRFASGTADPLHLGKRLLHSRDEATQAVKKIRENLIKVFDDLQLFRGADPLELGRSVLRSRDEATRAAKLIRGNIEDVFRNWRPIQGNDPLGLGRSIIRSRDEATRAAKLIRTNIGRVFEGLSDVVGPGITKMMRIVGSALRALGGSQTSIKRISTSIERIEGKATGGFIRKAVGGIIPGQGLQDTVPMYLPPGAVVENRHQQPVIDRALQIFDRLKMAVGGLVPVLAAPGERVRPPQDVPRVQQALAATAAAGYQPFGSLEEVFGTITRPHYAATGGWAGPTPTRQAVVQRVVPAKAEQPFTLYQDVVQRFKTGGQVRGIVPIPGQPGESIHSSIVKQVVSLVRRYKLRVTDGYALSGHAAGGEHPEGLAIDVIPGKGGSWDLVDRLAAWAEPRQGQPRAPFRWVGYTGDSGHGRGNHLHLSWGGDGGTVIDVPRVRAKTRGPASAARSLVSGALEKVQTAANRRLRREEGVLTTSGPVGKGGALASSKDNRKLGRRMMGRFWRDREWPSLATLWQGESGWKTTADNPSSSAYGIPQALPGSKMRSAGKDWETNPATQIRWGLRYIKDRYGSPSKALAAWRSRSPHWYAKGGFVGRGIQAFAGGGRVLSRLPGGKKLAGALSKYDDLASQYAAAGQQLASLAPGGTVQTSYGTRPTLGSTGLEEYVLKGHAIKPSPFFLKTPRSGKRKKDKKPGKGKKTKQTKVITGAVDNFDLGPFTNTIADYLMPGLLDGVDALIDPQLEKLSEDYGLAEGLASAVTEEFVVTEDKLGKAVPPFIDQTLVQTRLGELDKLISIKSTAAAKMQEIVAAVEYAIQLLLSGILRRQLAVKAIELKVKQNKRKIKDLKDKLDEDGGGGINRAIELLDKKGEISEAGERRVRTIWRAVFGSVKSLPYDSDGKIKEGEALTRLRQTRESYKSDLRGLIDQNAALDGDDGLKDQVIENSTQVWEPNVDTLTAHLTTYRGSGGGWLGFDPFKEAVADPGKLKGPATAAQRLAYKPFTGALGEALWTLERDPKPFPDGNLIAERAELLQQPAGGVLDTLLKRAQAGAAGDKFQVFRDMAAFMTAMNELLKQGSNIKSIPKFARGGLVTALVGEEGPEIVKLPIGARVHSHSESLRMAETLKIPGFAKGGFIDAPVGVQSSDTRVELEPQQIRQLIEALKDAKKEVHIDARQTVEEAKSSFELAAALGWKVGSEI